MVAQVVAAFHVQEMLEKAPKLPRDIQWHFIGHLQSNKVKAIIGKPQRVMLGSMNKSSTFNIL